MVSAGGLYWLLRNATTGRGALARGWWFGVGKYGVGASWIYVSIHVYGPTPAPLAALLVVVFVAGMALACAATGWTFQRLRNALGGGWLDVATFAWAWLAWEWALTWLLTGFPWLFAGYAFLDTPLAGLAPVGGVLLVSLAGVASSALAVQAFGCRRLAARGWALGGVTAIWAVAWGLGAIAWTQPGATRSVALVQGNLPQETKWTAAGWKAAAERFETLSAPLWNHDIVLWPEAAIPAPHRHNAERIAAMRAGATGDLLLGALVAEVDADDGARYYNAAIVTGGGQYRKRRLVPFGEYVPLAGVLRGAIAFFDLPMSNTTPGVDEQALLEVADLDVAVAICYEIAYPRAVARQAASAALLATISNDTWFGASLGPPQHLQIARMRALENGKFLLRATNNGITAIVNERGDVVSRLPQFEAGALTGTIRAASGATPFARLSFSPTAAGLAGAALLAIPMWLRRRRASADAD